MSLSVTSVERLGQARRARLIWQTPWGYFPMIVRSSPAGIHHEGVLYEESATHFPSPIPMFPEGARGATFSTPDGSSTIEDDNALVNTWEGAYSGVRKYSLRYSEGTSLQWYLAKGTGFVQFGEGESRFSLAGASVRPESDAVESAEMGACAAVGIDPNPQLTTELGDAYAAALKTAVDAGSRYIDISVYWRVAEPSPGRFDLNALEAAVTLARANGLAVSLTIKTANTTGRDIPPDLANTPWNSQVMLDRWAAFLVEVTARLGDNVKWVNLGNEVDFYFFERPGEVDQFKVFFLHGVSVLRALKPGVSVGLVFAHDSVRYTDRTFHQLKGLGDHIAFTYYNLDGRRARDTGEVAFDIPAMVNLAGGKPVIFTEIGYSSTPMIGGSADSQRQFFDRVFDALALLGNRVAAVRFFQLSDLPLDAAEFLAGTLGQLANAPFVAHLGSLGVFDRGGRPKPAWESYKAGVQRLAAPGACTVPRFQ